VDERVKMRDRGGGVWYLTSCWCLWIYIIYVKKKRGRHMDARRR
jgi:hypothetical protein